ncbi:MAG: flagellar type III secretion system pore protein FliP [Alphaproteobacteria bacterium]|nr:flagellar type III secretion system pore protein FliP [Alphaproteobacteria bacterium]
MIARLATSLAVLVLMTLPAGAQEIALNFGEDGALTERIVQILALVTILSLAPSILIMVTSFVRIVVVLSLLRTAIGAQQSPPNTVIVSLALFLTAFVMAPTFDAAYRDGIAPLLAEEMDFETAWPKAAKPVQTFMLAHVRDTDLELFLSLAKEETPANAEAVPYRVLIPAFMISELRRAFEIGFLVFLPFLVIDLVVASILMSMGMMMLPPIIISLPFKLIFFVLVDGWHLITGSLVQSYAP